MAATGWVLCDDLIFTSRITGTARSLGLDMKSATLVAQFQELARHAAPACVLVDLSCPGLQIDELVAWLKANIAPPPRIIAYGSHVDVATLSAARKAGCDLVLPRSKFVEVLADELPRWFAPPE